MKNIPKKIFLQVGDLEDDNVDFSELSDVTWSSERIYKNDVEYILKPARAKKPVEQMAKEANGRSRACDKCIFRARCRSMREACNNSFVEGYTKGYKQAKKGG